MDPPGIPGIHDGVSKPFGRTTFVETRAFTTSIATVIHNHDQITELTRTGRGRRGTHCFIPDFYSRSRSVAWARSAASRSGTRTGDFTYNRATQSWSRRDRRRRSERQGDAIQSDRGKNREGEAQPPLSRKIRIRIRLDERRLLPTSRRIVTGGKNGAERGERTRARSRSDVIQRGFSAGRRQPSRFGIRSGRDLSSTTRRSRRDLYARERSSRCYYRPYDPPPGTVSLPIAIFAAFAKRAGREEGRSTAGRAWRRASNRARDRVASDWRLASRRGGATEANRALTRN